LDQNEADVGGCIAATTLTIADSTVTNNLARASTRGGAFLMVPDGFLTAFRTELSGNEALLGGAIYTWSDTLLSEVDGHDNTADEEGASPTSRRSWTTLCRLSSISWPPRSTPTRRPMGAAG
jgi:hypothetical protein